MSWGQLNKTFTNAAIVFRTMARLVNYMGVPKTKT